jgi:hypothetical protein
LDLSGDIFSSFIDVKVITTAFWSFCSIQYGLEATEKVSAMFNGKYPSILSEIVYEDCPVSLSVVSFNVEGS